MGIVDLTSIHLFLRLLIGFILLSVAVSKLAHPRSFRNGIREYQIIPDLLESKLALSTVGAYGIPFAELAAGLGLVSSVLLVPAALLALGLFVIFSGAILINLLRGRTDLSCHCGGALGDHRISWKLLARNLLFLALMLLLLWTPPDLFTLDTLLHHPSALNMALWVGTALPLLLLVIGILVMFVLLTAIRHVLRSL